jgi:Putative beta-barrel porin-2, OmpL-like. bbp2
MRGKRVLGLGLAILLGGSVVARGQAPLPNDGSAPPSAIKSEIKKDSTPVDGKGPQAAPVTIIETPQAEEPPLGPTAPEDVKLFMNSPFGDHLNEHGIRLYGWLDGGYTYSSTGPGLLATEPRENRYGNEILGNQAAIVLEKTLRQDEFNIGFNATLYGGADAALLRPLGGFTTTDPRFGVDFRQLYISAHLPVLTDGGVDLKVGRMGTIIGYESALAPYRPLYSNDYQWFYSEDGAWTGALANLHVNKQLDVLAGVTMGANTFFTMRGQSPCFIGQINYWLQEEKKTMVTASVHVGDQAIFAAPGLAGNLDTVVEFRIFHNWSKYLSQVVQTNMGWDQDIPGVGTGSWYGVHTIIMYHLTEKVDLTLRPEWFEDVQGTRIGVKGNFEEVTLGFDYHPCKYVSFRPEVRGDWSENPAFGPQGDKKNQLTAAFEVLLKF